MIANHEGVLAGNPIPMVIRVKNLPKEMPVPNRPPVSISEDVRLVLLSAILFENPVNVAPPRIKNKLSME
jgi:hypothetical protein